MRLPSSSSSSSNSSSSRSRERKTQPGARRAAALKACVHAPRASEDSGQGFLFHSTPQWIQLLGRYLTKPSHWRTGATLCPQVHSDPFKHQQTCTQSAIEGQAGRLEFVGGKNTEQCFPPPLDALRPPLGQLNCTLRIKISSGKKRISVVISVGCPVKRSFQKHISSYKRFILHPV